MTEVDNAEQLVEEKPALSFGEHLSTERKRQNISVAEVANSIHLAEKVIDAIERSDVNQLPQPTFVQGYLRAYAKYLDISEALILEAYAQTVPRQKETELQARSLSPDQINSNAPLVKMVTIALLVIMLVAALYASFDYYKSAIQTDEAERDNQTSLSLSESELTDQSDIKYDIPSEQAVIEQDIPANIEQDIPADV
ncbi:MAG: helix-turn-helix domain-containing protein, partial [Gammaproteobacteria bacterium]|nr:helix-turn-helix domain-containing protein [Gammaproteobacteria bacterium]